MRASVIVPLLLVACQSEVTPEQRQQAEALVAEHEERVAATQARLVESVDGQLGPLGPVSPRPDLGGCSQDESAADELAAEPLPPLTAETSEAAEVELTELAALAKKPTFTTPFLLVPSYEIFITPQVDPEFKGFKPGVGRAWLAMVAVDGGEIVCVGTSSVQVTTADVQIRRRPVPADLPEEERARVIAENLRLAQEQIEGSFRGQLLFLARQNLAKAGPYDAELATEKVIDVEEAKRLLER